MDNKNFVKYIEGILRIGPYSDQEAKEAVELMRDTWSRRLEVYAIVKSEQDEKFRIQKAERLARKSAKTSKTVPVEARPAPPTHEKDASDTPNSSQEKPVLPQEPAVAVPLGADPPLPTVDESRYAYSAWLMHEDLQQCLLAAAEYMDHFQMLNLTLSDDPALENVARLDAFRLLYEGGRGNIHASRRFLEALRRQVEAEGRVWQGQGIRTHAEHEGSSKAVVASSHPQATPRKSVEDDSDLDSWDDEVEDEDV